MATEYFNDAWRIPNNKNQSLVSNYSMQFDGVSDVINTSFSPPLGANNRTISIWFKTGVNAFENICGYGTAATSQGFDICTHGSPSAYSIGVHAFGPAIIANGVYIPNQWNHYVVTYDGTILRGYLNGQPVNTSTIALNTGTSVDFTIGGGAYTPSNDYAGSIDQVCIFDYALPATGTNSVATLYGGGTAVTNPMTLKPIAYYQLGDQSAYNGANYLVPNNSLQDYVFDFDGNNDRITTDFNFPLLTTNFSFSVWIKPESTTIANVFIANNDSSSDGYNSFIVNNSVYFRLNSSDVIFSISGLANTWIHVVGTYDGSTQKLYINNNTPSTKSFPTSLSVNDVTLIGVQENLTNFFNGSISNVSLYNTTLTDLQVATLYNNGSPATDISSLNPVSWWKLNAQDTFDGTNWTIKDYAGSNNGTSSGMTSANLVQSNLQHTSGYSPYALSLDRADGQRLRMSNGIQLGTNKAVSMWIKFNNGTGNITIILSNGSYQRYTALGTSLGYLTVSICEPSVCTSITTTYTVVNDVWFNLIISGDGTTATVYVNGQNSGQGIDRTPSIVDVGNYQNNAYGLDGDLSNLAVWQSNSLTSAEATEIFNSGRPSNLNNFSGTKPTAWWQLGSNSSFNATTSQWTCLDEIGTNNISTATNDMSNDDITNGVGYSANGLGTSSIEIIGDAPYSTANGISENMDVLDRTTDVPG